MTSASGPFGPQCGGREQGQGTGESLLCMLIVPGAWPERSSREEERLALGSVCVERKKTLHEVFLWEVKPGCAQKF